jgi:signal transduction histidine kinase/ligand-binding sensor domain-containing protein
MENLSLPTRLNMMNTQRMRVSRLSFGCFLLFLFLTSAAFALNPERHISQYGHTAWRIQDGFFGGRVRTITQTTDGYIWVGTEAGLFRFDGVRFVSWSSQELEQPPSTTITALLGARDGSLWIGTDAGLVHEVNNHLITYLKGGGLITSILQDVNGEIWVAHHRSGDNTQPLCRVIRLGVRCYGNEEGVPPFAAGPLAQDPSGNLWIGGDTTLLRWRPGSSNIYRPKGLRSNAGVDGVEALSVAADGSLWVGMAPSGSGLGLQHLVDGRLKSFITPKLNGETLEVATLLEDRQNTLWVGSFNQGIYRIHGADVDHYRSTDGLSSDSLLKFYEDREGNLWVATTKGLDCFRDLRVSSFSTREGLSADAVDSVLAARDGTIWIGNASNLDVLDPGGVPSQAGKASPGHQVTSLLEDRAGRLWAGIDNTLTIHQGRRFRQIKRQESSPLGVVTGITEDSQNNIWAQTLGPPGPLIRIQDRKVREAFLAPQMPLAREIVADPQSGIWLGLLNGDLARYRSGKIEIFPFPHHPASRVNQLIAVSDGSILGATAFGVVGWKNGKRQILTVRNGLPCDTIHALIRDNKGDLWLYAQCGLIEIADAELQRWWEQPETRLKLRVFDASDGVQPGQAHFNASAESPDGRLWFANGSVLQMIDPNHMAGNALAPPVHIQAIVADRNGYTPQNGLRLPPLTRDLEIDYTALSFVVPQKVLFRYMLEGHDTGWQEAGTRRQALYNDLRPGHYRFRVIACNNDGVWNAQGAMLIFSVAPAWYQTIWFRFLGVFSGLFFAWSLYRLRLHQMAASMSARFDERLAERTRLARELHDAFLQTVQGSKLVADHALKKSSDPVQMHRAMEQLSEWLARAIQEGRAALNSLRTSTTQRNDLADALQRATENGFVPGSMAVNFSVIGVPGDMHPVVRDEVYRIGYEAIRNAGLHSSATQLAVELRYSQDLTLRVSDNGIGIDPAIVEKGRDGHFGLQGMRERAARIGAKLALVTSASGTEIKLVVPGGIIFRTGNPLQQKPFANLRKLFRSKSQNSKLD